VPPRSRIQLLDGVLDERTGKFNDPHLNISAKAAAQRYHYHEPKDLKSSGSAIPRRCYDLHQRPSRSNELPTHIDELRPFVPVRISLAASIVSIFPSTNSLQEHATVMSHVSLFYHLLGRSSIATALKRLAKSLGWCSLLRFRLNVRLTRFIHDSPLHASMIRKDKDDD
jgi:hypothetical protein